MIGAYRAAWTVLRRPTLVWPSLAAVVLFSITTTTFTFSTAAAPGGSRLTSPPTTLADLDEPDALAQLVGRPVMVVGLVVLAAAILQITGQHSSGFIRVQLVAQPRRAIWLAGNWLALSAAAVIVSIVGAAVAALAGLACAAIWHVDTAAWSEGLGQAVAGVGNLALGMIAFALVGSALAVWLRSAIAALTVALVYALFENAVTAVAPVGQGLLPVAAFSTVSSSGLNGNLYLPSLLATVVFTTAVAAATVSLLASRDVLS